MGCPPLAWVDYHVPDGALRLGTVAVFRLRTDNDAIPPREQTASKECMMFGKAFARCVSSRPPRGLSRRRFLQAAAGSAGTMAAGFLWPTTASAAGRDPKPLLASVPNATGGPVL